MGLNLKDLVVREKTTLESFASRIIAIDAYNALYQFLATIRGYDGAQLADSQGAVTSHLSGLFYRNINFLSLGIRPVYVFDGKPPSMKSAEIMRRKKAKKDASIKYERAISEGNMADARKYAQQTTSMQDGMVDDSKKLQPFQIGGFGILSDIYKLLNFEAAAVNSVKKYHYDIVSLVLHPLRFGIFRLPLLVKLRTSFFAPNKTESKS